MRSVKTSQQKRDQNGKKLCKVCEKSLPKNRSSYCSDECWTRNTPSMMRSLVWDRDLGVCSLCHVETKPFKKLLTTIERERRKLIEIYEHKRSKEYDQLLRMIIDARDNVRVSMQGKYEDQWHADHILPVVEGGGLCGLEGYRTLCLPCHKKVTKELRQRLSKKEK